MVNKAQRGGVKTPGLNILHKCECEATFCASQSKYESRCLYIDHVQLQVKVSTNLTAHQIPNALPQHPSHHLLSPTTQRQILRKISWVWACSSMRGRPPPYRGRFHPGAIKPLSTLPPPSALPPHCPSLLTRLTLLEGVPLALRWAECSETLTAQKLYLLGGRFCGE